jgi:hypothetical protein
MIKVGNDSFHHTQFGLKASETISQRGVFAKIKSLLVVRIINKPVGAKFKTGK